MGEEPPRTGSESLDPEATSRHRPLSVEGVAVKRVNFAGKEGAAREEGQYQGADGKFALFVADDQSGPTCGGRREIDSSGRSSGGVVL